MYSVKSQQISFIDIFFLMLLSQLVEKLSAKSPDGPTKMKILAAIAEEHNVKWDPESFEEKESKPPEDLLVRLVQL